MKPARFEYHLPETRAEALAVLAEYGYDAKVLAGGQSLVPTMNFRLARPAHLVDVNRVPDLAYVEPRDGGLAIGAMTRQRTLEKSAVVVQACPLLAEAVGLIGHVQIRTRGTLGGSLAHADPAAELPAVVAVLGGTLRAASARGERTISADDFFVDYLTTSLAEDELLTEVWLPVLPPRSGTAFVELSRRHGDFALAGVAAVVTLDGNDTCADARLALIGVGGTVVRARDAEQSLVGGRLGQGTFTSAGQLASEAVDPPSDVHAPAAYRKHLAAVLTAQALAKATQRATAGGQG